MTREEWKALSHSIRADARAFKDAHGGYPCFVRHFMHNGKEYWIKRVRLDGRRWCTRLNTTLLGQRPLGFFVGRCFAEILELNRDCRATWKRRSVKRAIRLTIEESRLHRIGAA